MKPLNISPRAAMVSICSVMLALLGALAGVTEFFDWVFPKGKVWNERSVLLLGIVLIVTQFLVMHEIYRQEYEAKIRAEDNARDLEGKLILSEKRRLMDVTTGIPNSDAFKIDVDQFFQKRGHRVEQAHVVLIDLHGFKKLNDRFGHFKADQLLRGLAQSIYPGMRRNEDMYKQSSTENTMYRMYPGGDEFLFLIESDLEGALRFVLRLQTLFLRIAPVATKKALGEEVDLAFLCAVVPVDRNDTYESVKKRLSACYTRATNGVRPFSICWHPGLEQAAISNTLYEELRKMFSITTADADFEHIN